MQAKAKYRSLNKNAGKSIKEILFPTFFLLYLGMLSKMAEGAVPWEKDRKHI